MASRLVGLLLWALAWVLSHGAAVAAAPVITLAGATELALDRQPVALVERDTVAPARVAAGALESRLAPFTGAAVGLGPANELWMPLRVHNPLTRVLEWELQVAFPQLDEATLFEHRADRWIEFQAGDRIPQSWWPKPGRFPRFELRMDPGETRVVLLRLRNAVPAPMAVRLLSESSAEAADMRAELGLGFLLGALALLVGACMVQALLYRDGSYFLYGVYALLLGFAFLAITGLAGQHLWGDHAEWTDVAKSVFPLASAGFSVLLVRALCRVRTRGRQMALATAWIGGLIVAGAVAIGLLRLVSPPLFGAGMALAAITVIVMAGWTWRRGGDSMGAWVFAAHAPLIMVTALIVMRNLGVTPIEFDANLLVALSIGVILVLLLVALNLRSREYLAVQMRDKDMSSIDPLTGLLSPRLFRDRVRAATSRYRKSRHDAVVLYVRLANYPRIKELHGADAAEQSIIRAAMKLQRLMPEADCYGRVSESTMGLIFETVTHRPALMDRAARLVAHGLMPLPGLKPEVVLSLHVVACILSENSLDAAQIQVALENALASMSPRTRRPIRFLEPGTSNFAPVEPDGDGDDPAAATQPVSA